MATAAMKGPKTKGPDLKIYGLLAALVVFSVAYAFWPSISQTQAQSSETAELLQALLKENERLRGAQPAPVAAVAAPVTASCNCDSAERAREAAERARESAETDKRALEKENRELLAKVAELKAVATVTANQAAAAAVVPASRSVAGNGDVLPVPSCAHQKLEFLRWQKDENGVVKQCPFIPENYENWQKMPPLCDYISIECLGNGNKRAAHVFGFGGPGLMIGYADVLMWEFVFARHQNLKDMVELGTMTGGTSLYFGMTANVRGGSFDTFDRSDNRASEVKRGWLPNMNYHIQDILTNVLPSDPSTHNKEVVSVLDVGHPVLGLFDNGDKKKETDCYARYMAVGSVLLLHDWEHLDLPKPHWEMTYSYVAKTLEGLGFQKAYFDFSEHIGSSTRAFIRSGGL